ncbi:MAG: alpha/beta hydrolase, partial [Alphaproteobacteria bacterium]|nr:alpha/beta hydrolase [Alphaproteobacteria bacterium]
MTVSVSAFADGPRLRERRFSSRDGLSLYYRDSGDPSSTRLPVLCLPGLTRNSQDFAAVAARLAAERRVICPDYRGRGQSDYDPDWRNYQPLTYVEDIRHLLAILGVERVVVIGTSMGGLLAAGMAAAMPRSVAAAVINDVGPEIGRRGLDRIVAYMRDVGPLPDWTAAVAKLRATFPNLPAVTHEDWQKIARATYREGHDGLLYPDWDTRIVKPLLEEGTGDYNFLALFRALRAKPVLLVRGERSDVLTAEAFERMGTVLPDARRVTVFGVGHAPSLSEPQAKV